MPNFYHCFLHQRFSNKMVKELPRIDGTLCPHRYVHIHIYVCICICACIESDTGVTYT